MGADLVIAIAPLPLFVGGEYVSDFDMIREEVLERLEGNYEDAADWLGLYFDGDNLDEIKENIIDTVEQAFIDMTDTIRRDITWLTFPDRNPDSAELRQYAITGGMTWGDDPTDAYRGIVLVENYALFEEPFRVVSDGT